MPALRTGAGRGAVVKRLSAASLGLAGAIVVFDQLTKAAVRASIPLHGSRTVIPGFLDLTHVQNSGAAFGILNAVDFPYKAAVIALVATIALVAIAFFAAGLSPHQRLARVGLALILGGAAGNLIDRVTVGLRGRLRGRVLARLALLGVQRRRFRDHRRRHWHDARHARRGEWQVRRGRSPEP